MERIEERIGAGAGGASILQHWFIRWSVPPVYGLCVFLIFAMAREDHRRVVLAEEVARLVNTGNPDTLEEWERLLWDHFGELIEDHAPSDDSSPHYRGYHLTPRVWLRLWMQYEAKSHRVVDAWMVYGLSERISFERPRDGLPAPSTFALPAALTAALVACLLWLWASQPQAAKGAARTAVGILALLPLLIFLPLALVGLVRVAM